jgi:hypothetical protein
LCKNKATVMHTCSIFNLESKVCNSKVRQGFYMLLCCV